MDKCLIFVRLRHAIFLLSFNADIARSRNLLIHPSPRQPAHCNFWTPHSLPPTPSTRTHIHIPHPQLPWYYVKCQLPISTFTLWFSSHFTKGRTSHFYLVTCSSFNDKSKKINGSWPPAKIKKITAGDSYQLFFFLICYTASPLTDETFWRFQKSRF